MVERNTTNNELNSAAPCLELVKDTSRIRGEKREDTKIKRERIIKTI